METDTSDSPELPTAEIWVSVPAGESVNAKTPTAAMIKTISPMKIYCWFFSMQIPPYFYPIIPPDFELF
ncbi:MAG: hypothetical protein ACPK85_04900 [Methanosarcina sp.]